VAGGYIQGGQGPLSGIYRLTSENALQFTIVLANGDHVNANSEEHPDIFWAFKGGGPGSFGIVTSVTLKTFDRVPVTGKPSTNHIQHEDTRRTDTHKNVPQHHRRRRHRDRTSGNLSTNSSCARGKIMRIYRDIMGARRPKPEIQL
jgi:hypothetical protein